MAYSSVQASRQGDKLEAGPETSDRWTVDKALSTVQIERPIDKSASPIQYFHLLERLKTTRRAGWKRFGIDNGESIADHMWRMALMAMNSPATLSSQLDLNKCIKMCLIHDLSESLVGDLTPADGVPKPEKFRRETLTMDFITNELLMTGTGPHIGKEMYAIWQEFEDGKTQESRFVNDLDKVELLLQMVEYEKRGRGQLDLSEFAYVATKIVLPETESWARKILDEREQFWAGHNVDKQQIRPPADMKTLQDKYYGA